MPADPPGQPPPFEIPEPVVLVGATLPPPVPELLVDWACGAVGFVEVALEAGDIGARAAGSRSAGADTATTGGDPTVPGPPVAPGAPTPPAAAAAAATAGAAGRDARPAVVAVGFGDAGLSGGVAGRGTAVGGGGGAVAVALELLTVVPGAREGVEVVADRCLALRPSA